MERTKNLRPDHTHSHSLLLACAGRCYTSRTTIPPPSPTTAGASTADGSGGSSSAHSSLPRPLSPRWVYQWAVMKVGGRVLVSVSRMSVKKQYVVYYVLGQHLLSCMVGSLHARVTCACGRKQPLLEGFRESCSHTPLSGSPKVDVKLRVRSIGVGKFPNS